MIFECSPTRLANRWSDFSVVDLHNVWCVELLHMIVTGFELASCTCLRSSGLAHLLRLHQPSWCATNIAVYFTIDARLSTQLFGVTTACFPIELVKRRHSISNKIYSRSHNGCSNSRSWLKLLLQHQWRGKVLWTGKEQKI